MQARLRRHIQSRLVCAVGGLLEEPAQGELGIEEEPAAEFVLSGYFAGDAGALVEPGLPGGRFLARRQQGDKFIEGQKPSAWQLAFVHGLDGEALREPVGDQIGELVEQWPQRL